MAIQHIHSRAPRRYGDKEYCPTCPEILEAQAGIDKDSAAAKFLNERAEEFQGLMLEAGVDEDSADELFERLKSLLVEVYKMGKSKLP